MGKQLEKYEPVEAEVLKNITRVYAARRAALLRVDEEAVRGEGSGAVQQQRRQQRRKEQGQQQGAGGGKGTGGKDRKQHEA